MCAQERANAEDLIDKLMVACHKGRVSEISPLVLGPRFRVIQDQMREMFIEADADHSGEVHTHTHTHTAERYTRTHACTCARAHTHTHTHTERAVHIDSGLRLREHTRRQKLLP